VKVCTKCKKEKPATTDFFHANKKYGLNTRCIDCIRQYERDKKDEIALRKKEYYEKNKKAYSDRAKLNYDNNKEKFAKKSKEQRERQKEYYQENKESIKSKIKKYKEKNPEAAKRYRNKNKEKLRIYCQRRKARVKGLPYLLNFYEWGEIKKKFNCSCAYCGRMLKLQQEHFVPLSRGGEYSVQNIIPACGECNNSKNYRLFKDWYPDYKFYSKEREEIILEHLNLTK